VGPEGAAVGSNVGLNETVGFGEIGKVGTKVGEYEGRRVGPDVAVGAEVGSSDGTGVVVGSALGTGDGCDVNGISTKYAGRKAAELSPYTETHVSSRREQSSATWRSLLV
jgi:hypothetical protein